jgi:hypothetical protein
MALSTETENDPDYQRFMEEMRMVNRELDFAIECKDDPQRQGELVEHLEKVKEAFDRLLE